MSVEATFFERLSEFQITASSPPGGGCCPTRSARWVRFPHSSFADSDHSFTISAPVRGANNQTEVMVFISKMIERKS